MSEKFFVGVKYDDGEKFQISSPYIGDLLEEDGTPRPNGEVFEEIRRVAFALLQMVRDLFGNHSVQASTVGPVFGDLDNHQHLVKQVEWENQHR